MQGQAVEMALEGEGVPEGKDLWAEGKALPAIEVCLQVQ